MSRYTLYPPPSCPLPRPGAKLPCSSQISTDRMWTPSIHPPALHRPGQRGSAATTDSPVLICHHYPPCLSLYTGPGAGLVWGQCRHCHCHGYFEFVIYMGGRQGNMTWSQQCLRTALSAEWPEPRGADKQFIFFHEGRQIISWNVL